MKVGISRNTYLAIDGRKFMKVHGEEVISPQHFTIKHKKRNCMMQFRFLYEQKLVMYIMGIVGVEPTTP